jgi:hypothetical protein
LRQLFSKFPYCLKPWTLYAISIKMFPFKTKKFSQLLEIPITDFENGLLSYAERHRFILVQKGTRRATISGTKMDWAISEVPTRNSFRPVIVFEWQGVDSKTLITGYYRLSKGVLAVSFAFLIFGVMVSVKERNFYPIILFILLWSFAFQLLGFLLFRKEFDWVKANFEDIVYEVLHTTKVCQYTG